MGYGDDCADEFAILRRRLDALEQEAERRALDGLGGMNRTLVGRVFNAGAMPDEVPGRFKVKPVTLDGTEAIGEPLTIADSSWDEAVVLVLGPAVPEVGDVLVAKLVDGYWVAQRGGAALCTMDLVFRHSSAFTNVNGDGEATNTVSPAIGGVDTFLVVPEYHPAAGDVPEYWSLTIADIHVEDGTYTFTMSRTGTGTQAFTKVVADCVETTTCGCSGHTWPATLYVTDNNGMHELTWDGGVTWNACYTITASVRDYPACGATTTGTVPVRISVVCPAAVSCAFVTLRINYDVAACGGALLVFPLTAGQTCASPTLNRLYFHNSTSFTHDPISASWTVPSTRDEGAGYSHNSPISGTVTLSE
jgi:hypothetical protein